MEGVDVWGRSPYSGGISEELRVLKTGDSMTGNLVMNGNHVTGLPLSISQIIDWSEAPSYKVVQNKVSEMIIDKVDKSGDIMTGSLTLNIGEDLVRYLGCSDLTFGRGFMLLLGTYQNSIQFELQEATPQPVKMLSNNGFLVQLNNDDIIRFGTNGTDKQILAYQRIKLFTGLDANVNTIFNLAEPVGDNDAASKQYVDNRRCLIGYIPNLGANDAQCGFSASASSEYNANYEAWGAFCEQHAWATLGTTTNFWIKIECPEMVKIWRFKLRGRNYPTDRIYNWRFEGSVDNLNWVTLYTGTNDYLGYTAVKTYDITSNQDYFQWYRIYGLNGEASNPGLSYFQIYTYLT